MKPPYLKEDLYSYLIEEGLDTKRLREGFDWAYELHINQKRKSGAPYIIHPVSVARQLQELKLDEDCIIAALLHDVIEDCEVKYDQIDQKFGKTVADLVLAETKMDNLTENSEIRFPDHANLRRMLISMTDDIRVLIIRLSDRLHNIKTIEYLKPERRISYSQETLNVYVPLAEYINIGIWKKELEDIAFKNINPELYEKVTLLINKDPRNKLENIERVRTDLENLMKENKIPCHISGRIKSAAALNNKINYYLKKGKILTYSTEYIYDLLAFRVITDNNNSIDCYKALGAIHSKYNYIPYEFDDYISRPKDNGYQSLQTDVYIDNIVVEIQIKTKKMHEFNEFGAASHIAYKLQGAKSSGAFTWVKNLVKWQDKNKQDFSIKTVLANKVFVFTPKGQVIEMGSGATVVDFAYRIHTKVGNSCSGSKVDGKIVPLDTKINTGEVIEIITSKNKTIPSKEWLRFTQQKTAAVIRREISRIDLEDQINKGREIFKSKFKENSLDLEEKILFNIFNDYGCSEEEFMRRIYLKMINLSDVFKKLSKTVPKQESISSRETIYQPPTSSNISNINNSTIIVKGQSGIKYYLAKYCDPTPQDNVIGFISLEHGITVHNQLCSMVNFLEKDRVIDVTWKNLDK